MRGPEDLLRQVVAARGGVRVCRLRLRGFRYIGVSDLGPVYRYFIERMLLLEEDGHLVLLVVTATPVEADDPQSALALARGEDELLTAFPGEGRVGQDAALMLLREMRRYGLLAPSELEALEALEVLEALR